jgi:hypothetical protein
MRAMRAHALLLSTALLAACVLVPSSASAGGVGGFGLVGLHFGEALREGGGSGRWLDAGGGLEIHLGATSSRMHGRIRAGYNAIIDLDGGTRHTGLVSAGVAVDLMKDISRPFGVYVLADVGVSPLVTHLRVFVIADVGLGVRVRPTERLELFGEVTGQVRFEKSATGGPLVFLGARFNLD